MISGTVKISISSSDGRNAILAARVAGALAGTVAVGLVMLGAYLVVDRRAALFAGTLAALYPGAIGMSVFILSEAIFCPLCLLSLIAWYVAFQNPLSRTGKRSTSLAKKYEAEENNGLNRAHPDASISSLSSGVSGFASGLACLARPSWFLWPLLLAIGSVIGCWLSKEKAEDRFAQYRMLFVRLFIFVCMMSITMSPWWIRNFLVTGRFVATTLQVGPSLYDGLHPGASGASDEGVAFSLPFEIELHREDGQIEKDGGESQIDLSYDDRHRDTFEWRLNRRMFYAAINWANENRYDTLRLAMVKFGKMWSPWPTAKELGGSWIRIAESVAYVVIVTLAVIAIGSVRQHRRSLMLFVSPTIYFASLHMIFVGSVRYRQPAILVLCVVAGIGAAWMLERINVQILQQRTRKQ